MFCSTACKVQKKNRGGYSYAIEVNRQQDSIDEGELLENTLDLTSTAGIERILEYARTESSGEDRFVDEFESLAAPMKPAALKAVNIRLDGYSGDQQDTDCLDRTPSVSFGTPPLSCLSFRTDVFISIYP